ncbi:MAG TPA: 30S ribosomal protein S17 [Vicinamibacteria bacterium]|nr:30S ribosomal protein S17 [Vicinamibacteria bacterium]
MTDSREGKPQASARPHRQGRVGVVTTARMQKTVVVKVERLVRHGFYRKTIRRTSTFMAHDELGSKAGDRVRIVETRPLSRHKRWQVTEILERAGAEAASLEAEAAVTATSGGASRIDSGERSGGPGGRDAASPTT